MGSPHEKHRPFRASQTRRTDRTRTHQNVPGVLSLCPCSSEPGGQGRDRTVDLPLFMLTFDLHLCVSAGQDGFESTNWAAYSTWSGGLAPFWPHGNSDPTADGEGPARPPPSDGDGRRRRASRGVVRRVCRCCKRCRGVAILLSTGPLSASAIYDLTGVSLVRLLSSS
jgi:hypothetical protein